MAKIVKTADAPEGNIEVVYAGGEFKVGGNGYRTDDAAELEVARTFPFLEVQTDDDSKAARAAERENEARNAERIAVEKAEAARAEKNPLEPAPEKSIPGQRTEETEGDSK